MTLRLSLHKAGCLPVEFYFKVYSAYCIRARFMSSNHEHPIGKNAFTDYETVNDRWEWVEKILPKPLVPSPPAHDNYPTPSGWMPPTATTQEPYSVRRTRNHMFPVYVEIPTKGRGLKQYTKIKHVHGDIWTLQADLAKYLAEKTAERIHIQVLEYAMTLVVDGVYHKEISEFLIEKGF